VIEEAHAMGKGTWMLVVVGCVGLGTAVGAGEGGPEAAKVSRPFEYSGYSAAAYGSFKTFSEYVVMSDGERLAVDVHLPADGPERAAFPVILEYLPYQRSRIDPATGQVHDATGTKEGRFFLSYGYALVRADMRGTGASTGWLMDFMPRLGKDGFHLVNWIARQPWCDGNIGMKGSSYVGWSQMATAARAPRGLKCIVPEYIPLDGYTGEAYPGGIFLESFFAQFSAWMKLISSNYCVPGQGVLPTKPVLDEDGDGELVDEIPVDVDGNGTFLDDGFPPTYRDGEDRDHVYWEATSAHAKGNYNYAEWVAKGPFADSPSPLGYTMYSLSPSAFVPGVGRSGIPVYHWGGWFDAFARGTFELHCTMAPVNPCKLLMAPSYHGFTSGPFWTHFGSSPAEAEELYLVEHLRFYDRYLKGIENGIDEEAPIHIYVMHGGGWRAEHEWPPARQTLTEYYFDADGALSTVRGDEGRDAYEADFTHDSRYAENQGNRYLGIGMGSPQAPPVRTEKDAQCLSYTSRPLEADTEVTGHPVVRFWVSSTADDGDFFVYLEDVDEGGQAWLVTEGQLRAGFAKLYDNDLMIKHGKHEMDVLPDLPWHGFEEQHYRPEVLAGDAVVKLVIDLEPTSWVFRKNHRIRVSLACADYPTFQLHPKLSPANKPDAADNVIPTISVHRGGTRGSHVELPAIADSGS